MATAIPARTNSRFFTLDAMRGVAALIVVALHWSEFIGGHGSPMAALAVDAFFVLSGFVIAHRYDAAFSSGTMTVCAFVRRRIHRLAPLYVAGFALGLLSMMIAGTAGYHGIGLLGTAIFNGVALPSPFAPASNAVYFPVNQPFWSLFFELWVANLAYAIFWRRIQGWTLWALIGISALGLIGCGLLYGGLSGGWNWQTMPIGFFRVGYSFFAGVALSRIYRRPLTRKGAPASAVLIILAATLLAPVPKHFIVTAQIVVVLLVMPALTYAGACATTMHRRIGELLGDSSYAIYVLHVPLIVFAYSILKAWIAPHVTTAEAIFFIFAVPASLLAAKVDERLRSKVRRPSP